MFWWRKKKPAVPDDEALLLMKLKKCRIVLPGRQIEFTYKDDWKSGDMETLYDFLVCYSRLLLHIIKQKDYAAVKATKGYICMIVHTERLPIWRGEYLKLLHDGAKVFGLKLFRDADGDWVMARCIDCDTCKRRVDCMVDEVS